MDQSAIPIPTPPAPAQTGPAQPPSVALAKEGPHFQFADIANLAATAPDLHRACLERGQFTRDRLQVEVPPDLAARLNAECGLQGADITTPQSLPRQSVPPELHCEGGSSATAGAIRAPHFKWGDAVAAIAQPVARVLDAALGTDVQNCEGCKKRQAALNRL